MTKEDLKKYIDEMEIYIPIRLIERNLAMPKTTIQQVLNGHRNLPKKWVKVLERYFSAKLYLGVNNLKFTNSGDKGELKVVDNGLVSKIEIKTITQNSYDSELVKKNDDEPKQWQEAKNEIPRLKGESIIDYKVNSDFLILH